MNWTLASAIWRFAQGVLEAEQIASGRGMRSTAHMAVKLLNARVRKEFGDLPGWDARKASGVVTRARNAWRLARALSDAPATVARRSSIPIDPDIRQGEPAYRYRVRIRYTDAQGGEAYVIAVMRSNRILTADQLRAQAHDLIDWTAMRRPGRSPSLETALGGDQYTVHVLSIGRRG